MFISLLFRLTHKIWIIILITIIKNIHILIFKHLCLLGRLDRLDFYFPGHLKSFVYSRGKSMYSKNFRKEYLIVITKWNLQYLLSFRPVNLNFIKRLMRLFKKCHARCPFWTTLTILYFISYVYLNWILLVFVIVSIVIVLLFQ